MQRFAVLQLSGCGLRVAPSMPKRGGAIRPFTCRWSFPPRMRWMCSSAAVCVPTKTLQQARGEECAASSLCTCVFRWRRQSRRSTKYALFPAEKDRPHAASIAKVPPGRCLRRGDLYVPAAHRPQSYLWRCSQNLHTFQASKVVCQSAGGEAQRRETSASAWLPTGEVLRCVPDQPGLSCVGARRAALPRPAPRAAIRAWAAGLRCLHREGIRGGSRASSACLRQ